MSSHQYYDPNPVVAANGRQVEDGRDNGVAPVPWPNPWVPSYSRQQLGQLQDGQFSVKGLPVFDQFSLYNTGETTLYRLDAFWLGKIGFGELARGGFNWDVTQSFVVCSNWAFKALEDLVGKPGAVGNVNLFQYKGGQRASRTEYVGMFAVTWGEVECGPLGPLLPSQAAKLKEMCACAPEEKLRNVELRALLAVTGPYDRAKVHVANVKRIGWDETLLRSLASNTTPRQQAATQNPRGPATYQHSAPYREVARLGQYDSTSSQYHHAGRHGGAR